MEIFSKVKKAVTKTAGKVATPIKAAAKAIKQTAVTTTLAIPRNAFLLLIRFNVHGWATGMQKLSFDQLKWWANLGGDRTALQKVIKEGAKNKRILGLQDDDVLMPSMVNTIGEIVTVTAALATATPIIVKLTDVLSKAEKISNNVENIKGSVNKTKDAIDKAKKGFKDITGKDVSDVIFKKDAGSKTTFNQLKSNDLSTPSDADADRIARSLASDKEPMNKNILLIGGAAALAALLIFKKK